MLTFTKGKDVKHIDPESNLIPVLLESGWTQDGKPAQEEKQEKGELEELRAKAKELGIKVHHKFGEDKIRALIEEFLNDNGQ